MKLVVIRNHTDRPENQQISASCFALHRGLHSNCVVTAAHVLDTPGDTERFGDIVEVLLCVQGRDFIINLPTVGLEYVLHPQWAASGYSRACDVAMVQFSEPSSGEEFLCSLLGASAFHLARGVPAAGAQLNILRWDSQTSGVMMMDDADGCVVAHARTDPGTSGGPWLDALGHVVAVHASAYTYAGRDGCLHSTGARGVRLEQRLLLHMLDMLLARSSSVTSNTVGAAGAGEE